MKKKVIKIQSIDETAGRLLISARNVVNGTVIAAYLNGEPTPWGKAIVQSGQTHLVGLCPLGAQYSLTLAVVQTVNTTLLAK